MNSATPSGAACANGCALYPNLGGIQRVHQSLNQCFNQLAFASPPVNISAITRENSLRGPDLTDVDLSLAKTWVYRGGTSKLRFGMDAVNVLNHPSFRNPSNNLNPNALTSGVPTQAWDRSPHHDHRSHRFSSVPDYF